MNFFNNRGAATHNIMEIKGTLKELHKTVQVTETFKSRKVWITTADNPQYPQTIELELTQNNVDKFNNISTGSEVNCHINLRGREWTKDNKTSVFNKLECWKVEVISAAKAAAASPVNNNNGLPADFDDQDEAPF